MRDCLEFPYMGRQGDALTTDARRNWNSLMTYFIYLGSVISNEDGSRRDNNKVSRERSKGYLVITQRVD